MVIPCLAVLIGPNETIFLQQHYWLQSKSAKAKDGQVWIYNTDGDWHAQLPFWSERTIICIVGNLIEAGLVISTQQYNASKMDKTNWYAIDYDQLARLTERVDDDDTLSSSSDKTETPQETTPEKNALRKLHEERRRREQADWLKRNR